MVEIKGKKMNDMHMQGLPSNCDGGRENWLSY